jgi:hypothetical protein
MRVSGFVSDRHTVVHYTQIKCMLEVVAVVSVVLLVVAVVVVIVGVGNVVDVGFANVGGLLLWVPLVNGRSVAGHCTALHPESEQIAEPIHIVFPVAASQSRSQNVHTRSRTWVVAATTRRPNH